MMLLDLRDAPDQFVGARPLVVDRPATSSVQRYLAALTVGCDLAALLVSFALGAIVQQAVPGLSGSAAPASRTFVHGAPYVAVLLMAMSLYGLHRPGFRRVRRSWVTESGRLANSLLAGSAGVVVLSGVLHRLAGTPKLGWAALATMSAPALALVPATRGVGSLIARRGGVPLSRVAVVGSSDATPRLLRRLRMVPDSRLVGLVADTESWSDPSTRLLGGTLDLVDICERNGIDRIFVSPEPHEAAQLGPVLRHLPPSVQVSIVPAFADYLTWQAKVDDFDGLTVVEVRPATARAAGQIAKRALDIVASAAALVCLAPLMALIAAAVKLTSPGPVLFRQTRIGYKTQAFDIFKFRSMENGADEAKAVLIDLTVDGRLFKLPADPRVTPVGRFLRRTSLDELPQFLNVLLGHMSLVGPRPLVPEESAYFDGSAMRRFDVKPGLTGLWQVSGRNDLGFDELCQLDCAYATSWSLWWDLKILCQTPASVLRQRGAY